LFIDCNLLDSGGIRPHPEETPSSQRWVSSREPISISHNPEKNQSIINILKDLCYQLNENDK